MTTQAHSKNHIAYLDSVRGLAALAVVSDHFLIAYGLPCTGPLCEQLIDYSPLHIWWDGSAAVSMFFVLSGLVLSIQHVRMGYESAVSHLSLWRYVVNRLSRIWPPYGAILLLSALLYDGTTQNPMPTNSLLPASDWITGMWHAHRVNLADRWREAFLLNLPAQVVLIPQAWTLEMELGLSLLLPAGLLLLQRGMGWVIFFVLLVTGFLDVPIFLIHFLMGLILARYFGPIALYVRQNRWQRRVLLVSGVLLYTIYDTHNGMLPPNALWLISGLGAVQLLMFVSGSSRAQAILSWSGLRTLGRVSYSLYLIHMLVLICLLPDLLQALEPVIHQRFGLWLCGWLLTIGLSFGLSLLSYRYLERPAMALGKRLGRLDVGGRY